MGHNHKAKYGSRVDILLWVTERSFRCITFYSRYVSTPARRECQVSEVESTYYRDLAQQAGDAQHEQHDQHEYHRAPDQSDGALQGSLAGFLTHAQLGSVQQYAVLINR